VVISSSQVLAGGPVVGMDASGCWGQQRLGYEAAAGCERRLSKEGRAVPACPRPRGF
jgi:hypothetical protein